MEERLIIPSPHILSKDQSSALVPDYIAIANDLIVREDVQASFAIENIRMLDANEGMEIFRLLDVSRAGKLTYAQIIEGCTFRHDVIKLLRKYSDTPLYLLTDKFMVERMLKQIDTKRTGEISRAEWIEFLALTVINDVDYLRKRGLIRLRCYWGKQEHKDSCIRSSLCKIISTILFVDICWLSDFWYYQRNNHFVLSMFLRDKNHPLKLRSSLNIEFVCQSFGFFVSANMYYFEATYGRQLFRLFTLFFIILPVVVLRNTLHLIYKCPCVFLRHDSTMIRKHGFSCMKCIGEMTGVIFFGMGLILLIAGITLAKLNGTDFVNNWIASWMLSYVLCVLIDLSTKFNPYSPILWISRSWLCLCGCIGNMVGLCRWQIEREKALMNRSAHPIALFDHPTMNNEASGIAYAQPIIRDVDVEHCIVHDNNATVPSHRLNDLEPLVIDMDNESTPLCDHKDDSFV